MTESELSVTSREQTVTPKEMEQSAKNSQDVLPEAASEPTYHIISPSAGPVRRAFILLIVCLALFIDAFNTGGMIIGLEDIAVDLKENPDKVQWVLTAFNLTFGSTLLLSGRVSDLYHPKPIFIIGFLVVGIFGLIAGFMNNIIAIIIFRAIQGMGASMTIPSAITMLTSTYTDAESRGVALTLFTAAGNMGVCLGFVIGGIIVMYSSWRVVFWVISAAAIPLAIVSIWLIPVDSLAVQKTDRKMDMPGVTILTSSLVLLIFGLSEAPTTGWGTAHVLAPIIIAVFMLVGFFWWQTRLHVSHALIPPSMWFIKNFLVLILVSFGNQTYFIGPVVLFSVYWPTAYGWNPLEIGLHFLTAGLSSSIIVLALPRFILRLPPKPVLVLGNLVCGLGSILFVYGDERHDFWSHIFPAFLIVTIASSAVYLVSNVGVITSVPIDKVGVGAAVFNAAQQVGTAVAVAVLTTIFVESQKSYPLPGYGSVSRALWWIVAVGVAEAISCLIFFKPRKNSLEGAGMPETTDNEKAATEVVVA